MVTTFSLENMQRAISIGKEMIHCKLVMAKTYHKTGDKAQENKYFGEACKLSKKVLSLELQVRLILLAINES